MLSLLTIFFCCFYILVNLYHSRVWNLFLREFVICDCKIPLGRSATHIAILLDVICDNLADYVRATRKSDNQLMIFNLMSPSGGMNPMMSEVDIIQDGDLNKSLQHYVSVTVTY